MKTMNLKSIMEAYTKMVDSNHRIDAIEKLYGREHRYYDEYIGDAVQAERHFSDVVFPLTLAIKEAEGRASARTITAEEILSTLIRIEDDLHISKKAMNGINVTVDINSQSFPKAYKYTPESTHFSAEYKNGSWRLTDIYRAECKSSFHIHIEHTEESKKAIIERLSNF